MLNLTVEEGYAYDYLSILEVKFHKLNTAKSSALFYSCSESLQNQVGKDLHQKIISSEEYGDLQKANLCTFDFVELARYGNVNAKEVDAANMKRYHCKNKLQNKFFPDKTILEEKT